MTPDPNEKRHRWDCPPYYHHRHWTGPWPKPPRHWFFMKVLMFLFWCCIVLTVLFLMFGELTPQRIFHAVGIVLLVMVVGGMFLGRMFKPLRWLIWGVREIAGGNLDFRFPSTGKRGEIWYLADQFNLMAERVQEMVRSKERLLVDVSHELRSPLTRLKVALEMTPKSKMRASMMRDIGEMEAMLGEILETEKLKSSHGKLELKPVALTHLVQDLAARYKTRKPGVKFMGKASGVIIQADAARVETVLRNVLENALKYSANQKKPVEIAIHQQAEEVEVTIQDHGPGIPKEEQERVFEPFYRVDPSRNKKTGGYGLGLSLCREIMRAHGGEIILESEPGQGTTVKVYWPN